MEIQSVPNADGNPDIAGFISFTIFKSHIATTPKKKELLTESEIKDIVERVMRDCDIDGNSRLSYAEFSKVLGRIPDFETKFRIYIQ